MLFSIQTHPSGFASPYLLFASIAPVRHVFDIPCLSHLPSQLNITRWQFQNYSGEFSGWFGHMHAAHGNHLVTAATVHKHQSCHRRFHAGEYTTGKMPIRWSVSPIILSLPPEGVAKVPSPAGRGLG
jgi:hypothetical protein